MKPPIATWSLHSSGNRTELTIVEISFFKLNKPGGCCTSKAQPTSQFCRPSPPYSGTPLNRSSNARSSETLPINPQQRETIFEGFARQNRTLLDSFCAIDLTVR